MHRCTTLDEKPPCSQWGETENLRNMAALCCNASTLLRAALSLPLFIISKSKTPAMHCLWGKKCVYACVGARVCVCLRVVQCAGMQEYIYVRMFVRASMLCLRGWMCVYVSASTASILNSFGGDCASLDVMNIRESIHLRGIQFHR